MTTPEARARENIDSQLAACGWAVQDRAVMNLYAGRGVAVREYPLDTGYADYLLFVDRKAVGVVEAKAEGIPLAGMKEPSLHSFRRAFALQMSRAGTNVYALLRTLGHAGLEMPRRYLKQSNQDLQEAHQRGSSVDKM
jgi:integrase